MRIEQDFNPARLTVGGILLAFGGGVGTQLASYFALYKVPLEKIGLGIFIIGFLVCISAFFRLIVSTGSIYPTWRSDLVESALRSAPPDSSISLLQTSFPNAPQLFPLLKELLVFGGKHFKIRVLMLNPLSESGKAIIAARVRLRDQSAPFHELEIKDQLNQFSKLKLDVDAEWMTVRDGAKLSLKIRLYDHLPFGPQHHIGDNDSFIGFFVSKHSSINAPMLHLLPSHGRTWQEFRDDYEHAWESATPHELV